MGKGIRKPGASHESERIALGELIHQHVRLAIETAVHEELRAQRDPLGLMRSSWLPDTPTHGAFLRWPPGGAAGWSCTSPTGRMRHFSFPHERGRHRATDERLSNWTRHAGRERHPVYNGVL